MPSPLVTSNAKGCASLAAFEDHLTGVLSQGEVVHSTFNSPMQPSTLYLPNRSDSLASGSTRRTIRRRDASEVAILVFRGNIAGPPRHVARRARSRHLPSQLRVSSSRRNRPKWEADHAFEISARTHHKVSR